VAVGCLNTAAFILTPLLPQFGSARSCRRLGLGIGIIGVKTASAIWQAVLYGSRKVGLLLTQFESPHPSPYHIRAQENLSRPLDLIFNDSAFLFAPA